MVRLIISLLALCTVASARMAYQLPDGVEYILSARSIAETFSCEGLPYGYYADTDNSCELFHICLPVTDAEGALIETAHFTMACNNETVFSQDTLTCSHKGDAFPCHESRNLYELSNADFGVIPSDVPRVSPLRDVPRDREAPEVRETIDVRKAPETPEIPENPEAAETPDVPEVPEEPVSK